MFHFRGRLTAPHTHVWLPPLFLTAMWLPPLFLTAMRLPPLFLTAARLGSGGGRGNTCFLPLQTDDSQPTLLGQTAPKVALGGDKDLASLVPWLQF